MAKNYKGSPLPLIGFAIIVIGGLIAAYGPTTNFRFVGIIILSIGAYIASKGY